VGGGTENTLIKDLIEEVIGFEDYVQRAQPYGKSFEWKVSGNPFGGDASSDLRIMVHLLTKILRGMNMSGWKLVASADVSAKYENPPKQSPYPLDTHSWFFLKDPDHVLPPGAVGIEITEENTTDKVPEIMDEHETCDSPVVRGVVGVIFICIVSVIIYVISIYV